MANDINWISVFARRLCAVGCLVVTVFFGGTNVLGQSRYATSDSKSGYVHWVELYDASNRRIDPAAEFPQPYSPEKTCGRCHEFDTISHGWHFNAVAAKDGQSGRPGQPWIWSDERTGTHLPLSYRGWLGTFDPDALGLSRWQVAAKLGGYLPGGGPGAPADAGAVAEGQGDLPAGYEDRSKITGPLPVDCMLCHQNPGSGYSPFQWTEQIEQQNFAYAPTAALGIAVVKGNTKRLKEDFDPRAEDAAPKLPKVSYEASQFRSDGKVFFDLIRKPNNAACYYCHTDLPAKSVAGSRWLHDDDVHIRAGIACADCHRNGLGHDTVRGFEGELHSVGTAASDFSCQGCHMGSTASGGLSGRLGAPRPAHKGLPPVHFEKLSCTACHSGSLPQEVAPRTIHSIAHHLGEHVKRTGQEFPGIVGPVPLPATWQLAADDDAPHGDDVNHQVGGKYTPHRLMWPSYWATLADGKIAPMNPEAVYDLIRKPLKVRRQFTEELSAVKLSLSRRKELLGDDRARAKPADYTPEEKTKVEAAMSAARAEQVDEKMSAALTAIEAEYEGTQAVYISGGQGFVLAEDGVQTLKPEALGEAAKPYAWPAAHNVRPARQSLGATGCTECHSDGAMFFATDIQPVGLLPDQEVVSVPLHVMQGVDVERLANWNQLFQGRSLFKVAGLIALGLTCLIVLSACAINLNEFWRGRISR